MFTNSFIIERRRYKALAASFICHSVLAVLALLWQAPVRQKRVRPPMIVSLASTRLSVEKSLPGLEIRNLYSQESWMPPDSPPDFENFRFEYSMIVARAPLLFPFILPGVDLNDFGHAYQ